MTSQRSEWPHMKVNYSLWGNTHAAWAAITTIWAAQHVARLMCHWCHLAQRVCLSVWYRVCVHTCGWDCSPLIRPNEEHWFISIWFTLLDQNTSTREPGLRDRHLRLLLWRKCCLTLLLHITPHLTAPVFKEGWSDVEVVSKRVSKQRDLEIVSERGGRARFPQKREQGRHPKIPCILVPALGWRKLFTLSISHCWRRRTEQCHPISCFSL